MKDYKFDKWSVWIQKASTQIWNAPNPKLFTNLIYVCIGITKILKISKTVRNITYR